MLWEKTDIIPNEVIDYISKDWDVEWFHSGNSTNPERLKKNLQMDQNNLWTNYCHTVEAHIQASKVLRDMFLGTKQSVPMFSWYHEGDYYGYHNDKYPIRNVWPNLNYTCYLNDDFEGGELIIKVGNVEVVTKPEKGKFVIYDSNLQHRVAPVTKGNRKVMLGWIETEIKDTFSRNWCIDYAITCNDILKTIDKFYEHDDDVEYVEIVKKLQHCKYMMLREYGRSD
jgi:PKHD-type hydroxylase